MKIKVIGIEPAWGGCKYKLQVWVKDAHTNFDNFVCIREEMCGKYGWFDASWRYRLPIYRTGYEMNAKQMKHYKGYELKIVEVYRKANENNVRL